MISPDELVVLDDRERASGLGSALAKILGRAPKIERLSAGDILVARRYLIERKTTEDFAASVLDGRLFNQIAQMREQRFEPVLILEGEFKPGEAQRLSPGALRGAILSVALDWRVPIVRSRGIADTALWIQSLLRRIEKKTA
ncbi:Hef nuclease, partial [Candidatus Sumerlaeota bacterium]|nr:Hef nuclease [Candidatus Sumerlaeota bacterium]